MNRNVFRKRSPLRFFVLVFVLSAPIWLIEPRDWHITASVGTPLVAALILVYREDGRAGTRRLLRRVFDQKRIKAEIWYVPVIFLQPAIYSWKCGNHARRHQNTRPDTLPYRSC